MAIGPDPRDLAAKAALAKRYGATDAWGNRIGGDEEPDEGAYNIARRLVAADIAAKGGASPYRELDTLDKMLGDSPVKQMVFRPSEEPRVGIEKPVVRGPMGSAAYEMLKNKRDSAWNFATGQPGERTHAVGMEPDENETAGAPVVNAALHNPAVQEIAAKYGLSNEEAAKVAAKAGIGGGPDEIEGSAGADAFKQSVVVPGARPATPAPRIATINPNTDGMEATTRDGAQAMRHIAMRADPAYRAAIEARKANAQLPLSEQTSLPVRTMLPEDRVSESAQRYGTAAQPAGSNPTSIGALLRQQVPALRGDDGLTGNERLARREAKSWEMIGDNARQRAISRDSGLPTWMNRAAEQSWAAAQDRSNLAREGMTAASQERAAMLKQQSDLENRRLDLQERQMNQGRDDARRTERLQAQAAWQAAEKKATELESVAQGSGDARRARADADQLKQFYESLQREANPGSIGQAARDAGLVPQAPVPGPIPGVAGSPAPSAGPQGPAQVGPMTQAWSSATGYPASHAAATNAIENPANTKSEYERGLEYVDRVGLSNFMNSPASQSYLANKIGPKAWNDVKMFYNWKLTDEKDNMLPNQGGLLGAIATGARAVNPYLMGFPRWLSQLTN